METSDQLPTSGLCARQPNGRLAACRSRLERQGSCPHATLVSKTWDGCYARNHRARSVSAPSSPWGMYDQSNRSRQWGR